MDGSANPSTIPAMLWDQDLYKRALDFAAAAHGEQKVPGSGVPYVVHLTKVAAEVLWASQSDASDAFDVDLAMACALLHDTMEDAGVTRESLEREFGAAVADGVQALTKDERLPKSTRMDDSLRRIRLQPKAVWVVKLADRVTNLEPPPPGWSLEKRRAYLEEGARILATLRGASPALEARLDAKSRAYEAHCR
jgi:(p)ppGpp synthase/HD superfamily hydrolase